MPDLFYSTFTPPPMSQEVTRRYRLSPQQRYLCLLQEVDGSDPYCTHGVILIEGKVEKQKLLKAIENVVERVEILRTVFDRLPTMKLPFQLVRDSVTPRVSMHDLSGLESHQQDAEIATLLRQLKQQPFDFAKGPLLKLALVELSQQKQVLLVHLPSLCADARGLENLTRELSLAYSEIPADDLIQYADIAEWQNELLEAEDRQAGRDYWRRRDWATLSELRLPFEPRSEKVAAFRFDTMTTIIECETLAKVEAISRAYNTTTTVFLLTCWYALLGRLTGQAEVSIGAGVDGRKYEELEEAVGLLAKYVPIHCRPSSATSFVDLLAQLKERVREACIWQEYFSWEQVDESKFKAADSWPRLFCFDFQEPSLSHTAANVTFTLQQLESCVDRFKIKLSCAPSDHNLLTRFQYDSNLYHVEDIERLAGEFLSLVKSAVADPKSAVGELNVTSEAEYHRLVVELNRTERQGWADGCIHHLFEKQAAHTPDKIAIISGDQQLTYGELNSCANQVARHLRRFGVAPEALVAICLDRSTEMLIAMLGIIKAGGAYVPLDPAAPHDRLSYMLSDTGARVVLTYERHLQTIGKSEIATICLDRDAENIAQELRENLDEGAEQRNLVYVMYTSGSTGQPKGVAVEHRQLVNYVNGILERLAFPLGSIFATVSTFTADLGNTSIFASLCSGGTLHVLTQELASSPEAFANYVQRYNIDCLKIVPAHLAALLTSSSWTNLLPRKRLVLGGEACGWELASKLQTVMPPGAIINHYGPTETTVGVLTHEVEDTPAARLSKTVPLGRPLPNSQVYLLDQRQCLVPTGVPGELYIGGEGVSRGYLWQPATTAEKFVPNLFDSQPGARLYRTGDLARYLPDGNIEFLGRIDKQIKIHGFRIEPGEIEAVLSQHPAVRENVVIAREDVPGQKRLVAYIVAAQPVPDTNGLQEFLLSKLPDYMIPAVFVVLDKLPLTGNGKIERAALPVPEQAQRKKTFVAPRTENERLLAGIWSKVLRLKQVSVNDNFFALGGDSILSIQIIARANQAGRRLTPRQLFQHQTIAELALVLDTASVMQDEQETIAGPVPCTPIQHWFFERELKDVHHWNQSMLLDCPADLDVVVLEKIVRHLLKHHDALRLRFRKEESDQWQQLITPDDERAPFTQFDLSELPESEKVAFAERIADELQASLNLDVGPIMRVAHFNFGEGETAKLLMIVHHLAVDGVSWRILLDDLRSAYRQSLNEEIIRRPAKTTSFKKWAEQLETYAQSESVRQEKTYWLGVLSKQTARIPRDFADGANTVALAQHVSVSLTAEETRALLHDVPIAYRTQINDVLLTALTQAFSRWTGKHSALIEVEGHGREGIVDDVDLSRTVGWFTTRFPVYLELGATSNPGDLLMSVKEQLRSIPHNGMGYGLLRYLSADQESAGEFRRLPHPEVSFNYFGQFQETESDDLFRVVSHARGSMRSPRDERRHVLEVNAIVAGGQLQAVWSYSSGIHLRTTIEDVAQDFLNSLRSLIEHCKSPGARGYTPSDFPLVNLKQEQLEKIFAKVGKQARITNKDELRTG